MNDMTKTTQAATDYIEFTLSSMGIYSETLRIVVERAREIEMTRLMEAHRDGFQDGFEAGKDCMKPETDN
jgi:hypothetical protein